jgi:VanZ family protein
MEEPLRLRWRALWLALGWLWVAAIVWLSLTPRPPEIDIPQGDKFAHALSYALLMFWFCQLHLSRRARIGYALGFVAMGIAIEFVQRATGYRSFELLDMAADGVGVLIGWMLALATGHRLPARLEAAIEAAIARWF